MTRTIRRRLIQLSGCASLGAIILALTRGVDLHAGPVRLSAHSPRHLLMLALVAALTAWAISLWEEERDRREEAIAPRRWGRFAALAGLLVVGLNVMMLAQPAMPTDRFYCMDDRPIGKGFRHILNCDSYEFMGLANEPSLVEVRKIRQSRPLSFGLAYLISRPLYFVPRLVKAGPYYPLAPEFVAYLIINLALLILALMMFTAMLEGSPRVRSGTELLFALVVLSVNDVTKLFFWTPHVQVYNLFIGCLTLYVIVRLIARGEPLRWRHAVALGLAFGAGLLIYGAFLIPVIGIILVQVIRYARPWPALLLGAVSILTYGVWVMLMILRTGTFVSHEVESYRQFVWVADCAKLGLEACAPIVRKNVSTFIETAAPVLLVPLALLFGLRMAGYLRPASESLPSPRLRGIGLAIICSFSVTTLFLVGMGFYAPRLIWLLVPSVLLAATLELKSLRLSTPLPRRWLFDSGVLVVSLAYVYVLLQRQGPYN